jgi:hypothetical protein
MTTSPHHLSDDWNILAGSEETVTRPPGYESTTGYDTDWDREPPPGAQANEDVRYADPVLDGTRYDDSAPVAVAGPDQADEFDSPATVYASSVGLPSRGVILVMGAATAACGTLDFLLTGGIGYFFDLCFVVICLATAMAAGPRALFTVGVAPPLVFAVLIGWVTVTAPHTIASGSMTTVFLTGLAAHAPALVTAYAVAILVACARGIAGRTAGRVG